MTDGYIVSGAGEPNANGTYCYNGDINGRPSYIYYGPDTSLISYDPDYLGLGITLWRLDVASQLEYSVESSASTPPLTGWVTGPYGFDPAYSESGRCALMAHNNVLLALRKLKNSNGDYVWARGLDGTPDTVEGYKVIRNQNMASAVEASAKVMLFGDFSKFWIRDVGTIELIRMNELFATYNQVGFACVLRTGSVLVDAGTYPLKYLQMHA